MSARRRLGRALLAALFAAAALRLLALAASFGRESVQADFSAFYTAGQAARAGLSPYWTHAERDPPLWDGVDAYHPSRFLYPPLAASLFSLLTVVPYAAAKHIWMALTLLAVAAALALGARALRWRMDGGSVLALGTFACVFQPLLTHLERGQVDAFTLLAIMAALRPLIASGRDSLASGALLALGTVLKPNVAALVPFLLLRRRWKALGGYLAGAAAAVALTVALHGRDGLVAYLTRELPRISVEGEAHGPESRLDQGLLARLRAGAPEGMTVREGRLYRIESFRFVMNASLVRPLKRRLELRPGPSRLSLLLLAGLVAVLGLWHLRHRRLMAEAQPLREMAFWQVVLAGILLCWPVTWAMNVVWLLLAALVVLYAWPRLDRPGPRAPLGACVVGLLLAAAPDTLSSALLAPLGAASLKYVAAEAIVAISLLAALPHLGGGEPGPRPAHGGSLCA